MKAKFLVRVVGKDGKRLFPCLAFTARILLKQGKCSVISTKPLTIKRNDKDGIHIVTKNKVRIFCATFFWLSIIYLQLFLLKIAQTGEMYASKNVLIDIIRLLCIVGVFACGYIICLPPEPDTEPDQDEV